MPEVQRDVTCFLRCLCFLQLESSLCLNPSMSLCQAMYWTHTIDLGPPPWKHWALQLRPVTLNSPVLSPRKIFVNVHRHFWLSCLSGGATSVCGNRGSGRCWMTQDTKQPSPTKNHPVKTFWVLWAIHLESAAEGGVGTLRPRPSLLPRHSHHHSASHWIIAFPGGGHLTGRGVSSSRWQTPRSRMLRFSLGYSFLFSKKPSYFAFYYYDRPWPKATWGGEGLFGFRVAVYHWGEVRAGTKHRQEPKQRSWGVMLTGLLNLLFKIQPRTTCPSPGGGGNGPQRAGTSHINH